jgi:hypothetical protein
MSHIGWLGHPRDSAYAKIRVGRNSSHGIAKYMTAMTHVDDPGETHVYHFGSIANVAQKKTIKPNA